MRTAVHLLLPLLLPAFSFSQGADVDFRYAPPTWQTIICMTDDWQKSLVSNQGALTYDYGPGPYAHPLTEVSVGVQEAPLPVTRQYCADARVPVVTTLFGEGSRTMRQEAFALAPEKSWVSPGRREETRVTRSGGVNGCMGWATPPAGTDPAFRNVAWGTNRPITYAVNVRPGSKQTVAIGLCESYKPAPRTRLMELRVEGAPPSTADPMRDSVKNRPYVYLFDASDENADGKLTIEAHASPKSPDPNVIMNAFCVFPEGLPVTEDAVMRGDLSSKAEVYHSCGSELESTSPSTRIDAILASFSGERTMPIVTVRTRREMHFTDAGELRSTGQFLLLCRPKAISAARNADGWTLELPEGTREAEVIIMHGPAVLDVPPLRTALEKARSHWLAHPLIPRGKITVPDSGIQYLLDASIRTMYQVREMVDGRVQFQPGPTVYRGLWAADALLTNIAVMSLGDTASARGFLESVLRLQLPAGQIRSLYPSVSIQETPIVLTAMTIYARSYGDSAWLRKQWPRFVKGMHWIEQMHRSTLADASALHYGLMPPSFVDGGISGETPDYGSLWWAMVSLERAVDAAQWLGIPDYVPRWKSLLANLTVGFEKAAARDLTEDRFGSTYLPVIMGDTSRGFPQRGQYAFLFPLPYGRFFQQPDSLMRLVINGNLAMLDSTEEEGLITSSGWVHQGVWPWLGGIHGIAHDLAGNASRAHDLLYAFANHATPTGTWVEEQLVKSRGKRTGGDVSDAEASAVFVYAVRRLLVRERLDTLEVLAGIPDQWLRPGSTTSLDRVFTEFGPLSLHLSISSDGSTAEVRLSAIDGRGSEGKPILFLNALKLQGFRQPDGRQLPDRIAGTWGEEMSVRCVRKR